MIPPTVANGVHACSVTTRESARPAAVAGEAGGCVVVGAVVVGETEVEVATVVVVVVATVVVGAGTTARTASWSDVVHPASASMTADSSAIEVPAVRSKPRINTEDTLRVRLAAGDLSAFRTERMAH